MKLRIWKNLDKHQPMTVVGTTVDVVVSELENYIIHCPNDGITIGDMYAVWGEFIPNEFEAYSLARQLDGTWEIHFWKNGEYEVERYGLTLQDAAKSLAELSRQYVC
jgi:hypothetical protein